MAECTMCGFDITLPDDAVVGELITCSECGSELEVIGINPFTIKEAPQEEEDWGE